MDGLIGWATKKIPLFAASLNQQYFTYYLQEKVVDLVVIRILIRFQTTFSHTQLGSGSN